MIQDKKLELTKSQIKIEQISSRVSIIGENNTRLVHICVNRTKCLKTIKGWKHVFKMNGVIKNTCTCALASSPLI